MPTSPSLFPCGIFLYFSESRPRFRSIREAHRPFPTQPRLHPLGHFIRGEVGHFIRLLVLNFIINYCIYIVPDVFYLMYFTVYK